MHNQYFSETTPSHLKLHQGLSERYQQRVIDVTLAAKLTLTYGKYPSGDASQAVGHERRANNVSAG